MGARASRERQSVQQQQRRKHHDDILQATSYDERGRRARVGDRVSRVLVMGNMQLGKTMLVMRAFRSYSTQQVMQSQYIKTIGVDFVVHREGGEAVQVWDTAGDPRFLSITSAYVRGSSLILICYNMADADALQHITDRVQQLRGAAYQEKPVVLVGLRGDEPRAVTLDEVCECATRLRVRCFGSDVAALPIAYDDWAAGALPAADAGRPARVHVAGATATRASASASSVASEYWSSEAAQRVDWRAAFQRRATRTGYGITTICRAPVIEFSSAAATDEQAAWLAHFLHDLAIENSLMDFEMLERDTEADAASALAMAL